jgi:hypothetical protein
MLSWLVLLVLGVTSRAGTVYPFRCTWVHPRFLVLVSQSWVFSVVCVVCFCKSLFVLLSLFLNSMPTKPRAIILSMCIC